MDNQTLLPLQGEQKRDSGQELFKFHARPLTAKLLETMELSKHFYHGEGDYLFYEKDGRIFKVLDLTGGYGANILGHRHKRILAKVQEWQEKGPPSLTQGSARNTAGLLAKRLSDSLHHETGEGPWISTLSNSGTEAVEAAYKHCLIYFKHKLVQLKQEVEKEFNQSLLVIKKAEPELKRKLVLNLRKELLEKVSFLKMEEERKCFFLHQLSNAHELEDLVSLVREINDRQLSGRPSFLALEKAYHGKTMGSLSLTSNEGFRNSFYLDDENNKHTLFISQYIGSDALEKLIDGTRKDLVILSHVNGKIFWGKHSFCTLAGAFAEPVQGEAGIIPVNATVLALLKKHSLQEDYLLVFDEIQAGMYRTGTLTSGSHTDITADIYTFSKSLGGGAAKIAATAINHRKYVEDFGFLHTSTFSDDDFSSSIALEVLDILQASDSPVVEGMKTASYLHARLESLKEKFPLIIKEIRGRGMMMAVEFNDVLSQMGFEFKTICDSQMQGYMLASALLNHENIRMSPSLSNCHTLRIQPSLYFTSLQAEELISALTKLCTALQFKDVRYFLSAMYPDEEVRNERTPDLNIDADLGSRPLAVFLCHLIDEGHVRKVTRALKDVRSEALMRKLSLTKDLAEFQIYHAQTLTAKDGKEIDIVMLGVPVTSEELKKSFTSRRKYKVVEKVQKAVDFAKEIGASTVGLGQFTSIVSGNGLYLDSKGLNLTTGNAYTTALAIQSALRSAEEKNIRLPDSTAVVIGAAGNIMSTAASVIADSVGKLILIHHSPIESSLKYQEAVKRILSEIASSDSASRTVSAVKKHWKKQNLISFLSEPEVASVFQASSDMNTVVEADIVLCGASSSGGFLDVEMFKKDAVIVDVAVPPSIKPEVLPLLASKRPDLTYHLGGVAKIPANQSINFFLFPLGENECYACMAETFALSFSGKKNLLNIGDLDKKMVLEVEGIAEAAGFTLGSYKDKSSL